MSANRSRPRDPIIWSGFQTVSLMIANAVQVSAHCERCATWWDLDLEAIRKRRGPHWTLMGRRLRCAAKHEATILALAPGRPAIPIHRSVAGGWSDVRRLQERCGKCGEPHGYHLPPRDGH